VSEGKETPLAAQEDERRGLPTQSTGCSKELAAEKSWILEAIPQTTSGLYKTKSEKQQIRNRLKRTMTSISKQIANMDPFSDKNNNITGYYGLISVQDLVIAKMEAKIIKITELPDGYKDFTPDCKERTR